MKLNNFPRISLAALALVLCTASSAMAQDGGPGMGMGGPRMGGHDHRGPGRGGPGGPWGFRPHGMQFHLPPGRWWSNPEMIKLLSITPDQRTKMDSILNTHRIELIDAVASVEKAEATLDPLVDADKPDEQAILGQIDKVAEARANLEKTHARMLLSIRAQLTPDQWMKLQTERPPMHGFDDRGPRGGRGDRGPGGPGSRGRQGGQPGGQPGPSNQPPAPSQQ